MKMGYRKLSIPNTYPKFLVFFYLEKSNIRYSTFKSTSILGVLELAIIEMKVLKMGNR